MRRYTPPSISLHLYSPEEENDKNGAERARELQLGGGGESIRVETEACDCLLFALFVSGSNWNLATDNHSIAKNPHCNAMAWGHGRSSYSSYSRGGGSYSRKSTAPYTKLKPKKAGPPLPHKLEVGSRPFTCQRTRTDPFYGYSMRLLEKQNVEVRDIGDLVTRKS